MSRTWKQGLLALPGIGVSLLPNLACPLCWPAYAGLLSSMGLGFLISSTYLLPLTAAFLALTVGTMAYGANKRHGYAPFALGLMAAIAVLLSKFMWDSKPTMYVAFGLLVVASLWNAWPRRANHSKAVSCPDCPKDEVR